MLLKHFTFIVALVALVGCNTVNNATFTNGQSGITKETYKAAEALVAQAEAARMISKDTPIIVGSFSDINNVEETSALGLVVSEQFVTRLVQLGFNVSEVKLRDQMNLKQDGEFVLSRDTNDITKTYNVAAIVSGTFAKAQDGVLFNSRMIAAQDGKLIAAQDFILKNEDDVMALINKKAKSKNVQWYGKHVEGF